MSWRTALEYNSALVDFFKSLYKKKQLKEQNRYQASYSSSRGYLQALCLSFQAKIKEISKTCRCIQKHCRALIIFPSLSNKTWEKQISSPSFYVWLSSCAIYRLLWRIRNRRVRVRNVMRNSKSSGVSHHVQMESRCVREKRVQQTEKKKPYTYNNQDLRHRYIYWRNLRLKICLCFVFFLSLSCCQGRSLS